MFYETTVFLSFTLSSCLVTHKIVRQKINIFIIVREAYYKVSSGIIFHVPDKFRAVEFFHNKSSHICRTSYDEMLSIRNGYPQYPIFRCTMFDLGLEGNIKESRIVTPRGKNT